MPDFLKMALGYLAARAAAPPDADPDPAELAQLSALLNRSGVRIMGLDSGEKAIGVWSDLDSLAIRDALRVMAIHHLPFRYLDGKGIPPRYRLRRAPGDPVPRSILCEMERDSGAAPWVVRDRLLRGSSGGL
jgi:hypothetical protein